MKLEVRERDQDFHILMTAETQQDAAMLARIAANGTRRVRYSGLRTTMGLVTSADVCIPKRVQEELILGKGSEAR